MPKKTLITVPKKTLFLVLPYLGPLSLQTRTKLRKSLKGILNCCKLQIVFKSQNKLAKAFRFKDRIPKKLTSGVVYKFQCGLCNQSYYGECVRHLNVRHIGISPLNRKKVEPKKYLTFFFKYFDHRFIWQLLRAVLFETFFRILSVVACCLGKVINRIQLFHKLCQN